MKKTLVFLVSIIASSTGYAGYNANMSGIVTHILTYTNTSRIYFRLDNQPTSHPSCNTAYFAIDATTPEDIRKQVLSRLLTAKTTGETVNIGYDNQGGCSHNYIKTYRVG